MLHGSEYFAPRMVAIAPAPEKFVADLQDKRYTYRSTGCTGAQAASIARRNARERNRVKQVNDGFNALRRRLPAAVVAALSGGARRGSGNKLSKVDTLRMVVEYIRYMEGVLEESDARGIAPSGAGPADSMAVDEGVYGGGSPYAESVPSPASETSSGVSSACSASLAPRPRPGQMTPMDEDDLLDAIAWWQQK